MKDSEFIELLNLYLDHEISAADAVRLEAEVQTNPERRRVYQQYCRMQKACKMLASDFQIETGAPADRKVVAFSADATVARSSRGTAIYMMGAVAAAAACVAIIFVGRGGSNPSADMAATVKETQPIAQVAPTAPAPVAKGAALAEENVVITSGVNAAAAGRMVANASTPAQPAKGQPAFFATHLLLTSSAPSNATLANGSQPANEQLKWLVGMELPPLQQRLTIDQLRFENPETLRPEGRPLGGRPVTDPNTESTAFRFMK